MKKLALLLFLASTASAQAYRVGEPLPDLRLPTVDGETLDLADYRGKRLLLIEFAAW